MERDALVYKAKLAEQAERFDEMVADMKEVAKQPQELTVEERNLLSVAYKNVIGSRRASWRVVTSIEQKGDPDKMTIIKDYKAKIEAELVDICNDSTLFLWKCWVVICVGLLLDKPPLTLTHTYCSFIITVISTIY